MKIITALLLLGALGCPALTVAGADRAENVHELLGSAKNFAIIRDATMVRACSIDPKVATISPKSYRERPDVSNRKDRGPYLQLSAASTTLLKHILLDDHSYEWVVSSLCMPTYTIRAEFQSGNGVVAASFCFGCHQVFFSRAEKTLGAIDLTAGATDELFQLFRQVFPDDPILNELARRKAAPAKN